MTKAQADADKKALQKKQNDKRKENPDQWSNQLADQREYKRERELNMTDTEHEKYLADKREYDRQRYYGMTDEEHDKYLADQRERYSPSV